MRLFKCVFFNLNSVESVGNQNSNWNDVSKSILFSPLRLWYRLMLFFVHIQICSPSLLSSPYRHNFYHSIPFQRTKWIIPFNSLWDFYCEYCCHIFPWEMKHTCGLGSFRQELLLLFLFMTEFSIQSLIRGRIFAAILYSILYVVCTVHIATIRSKRICW